MQSSIFHGRERICGCSREDFLDFLPTIFRPPVPFPPYWRALFRASRPSPQLQLPRTRLFVSLQRPHPRRRRSRRRCRASGPVSAPGMRVGRSGTGWMEALFFLAQRSRLVHCPIALSEARRNGRPIWGGSPSPSRNESPRHTHERVVASAIGAGPKYASEGLFKRKKLLSSAIFSPRSKQLSAKVSPIREGGLFLGG